MVVKFTSVYIICLMLKFPFETSFEVQDVVTIVCRLYTDCTFTPNSYGSYSLLYKWATTSIKAEFFIQVYASPFLSSLAAGFLRDL